METFFQNERIIRREFIETKYSHTYKKRLLILTEQYLYITRPIQSEAQTSTSEAGGVSEGMEEERTSGRSHVAILNEKNLDIRERILNNQISDINLFNDQCNPSMGYFEITVSSSGSCTSSTPSTSVSAISSNSRVRFRCPFDSASLWARDLRSIPNTIPRAKFYQETLSKPKSASRMTKFLRTFNFSSVETPSYVPTVMFTFDQAEALQRLYNFISSSTEICVCVIIAVFDAINQLEKTERAKASRQLGHALAMWLGETDDAKQNVRRASFASFSGKSGKPSRMEILRAWLEISLLRELEESCHFSPETIYPQAKRNLNLKTAACTKSDGPAITPLRRDNVESLFLSNFIKGVAVHTGVLSRWLLPSLIRIASDPLTYSGDSQKSDEDEAQEDPSAGKGRVYQECETMFETMRRPDILIPPSLMLLICIIQKLTDTPQQVQSPEADGGAATTEQDSVSLSGSTAHQDIFYASSCAALFLRLICPAIISPLEWGALRPPPQFQRSNPQPSSPTTAAQTGGRESDRGITFQRTFSEMNFSSKTSRSSFIPSLLMAKKEDPPVAAMAPLSGQPTEEELKSINAMDQNPAVAAVILVAHLLGSVSVSSQIEIHFPEEEHRNVFSRLIETVVRIVPLQKLEVYMQRYEEKAKSIVDPSTQKSFESPHTKKALLNFARSVQKIANLSIVNRQNAENHAIETLVRKTGGSREASGGECGNGDDEKRRVWTLEMLRENERREVIQQIEAAQDVRQIYETIAQCSLPVLNL